MKFDRNKFFDGYKRELGSLNNYQVAGLNRLLDGYETYYGWWDSIPQIANSLAQVGHETAHSFNPVVEGYYLAQGVPADRRYFQGDYDVVRRFQQRLRYFPDFGRGDIQLTWLENYQKMDALLRRYFPEVVEHFQSTTGQTFDLIKHPEQLLDGKISFCVMTVGMHRGTFTGHKLDDYNLPHGFDHFNARSIVNGDKHKVNKQNVQLGDIIAGRARKFETILKASKLTELTPENVGEQIDLLSTGTPAAMETNDADPLGTFQPPVDEPNSGASDDANALSSGSASNSSQVQQTEQKTVESSPDGNAEEAQTSTKSETIFQKIQKIGDRIQTTTEKVTSVQNSVAPISNASWFMTLTVKAGGWFLLIKAFAKDNWLELVIAFGLIALAVFLYNSAKNRAVLKLTK